MRETKILCNGCGKLLHYNESKCDFKSYFIGTDVDGILSTNISEPGMDYMHFCPECEAKFLKDYHINIDNFDPVIIKKR